MNIEALFPAAPAHAYTAAPIYLEPMMGSGERIAVLAVAIGENELMVEPLVTDELAQCLYGAQAKKFIGTINMVADNLSHHLAGGKALSEWPPCLANAHPGQAKAIHADSAAHAISQIARLHASLARLSALADDAEQDDAPSSSRDYALPAWVKAVQTGVVAINPLLSSAFNTKRRLAVGDEAKIGFIHGRYAAQFGIVTPIASMITSRKREAKAKLWDLQHLDGCDTRELIVAQPRQDDPYMADRAVADKIEAMIESLRTEARQNDLDVVPVTNATEAAEHLLHMAA